MLNVQKSLFITFLNTDLVDRSALDLLFYGGGGPNDETTDWLLIYDNICYQIYTFHKAPAVQRRDIALDRFENILSSAISRRQVSQS